MAEAVQHVVFAVNDQGYVDRIYYIDKEGNQTPYGIRPENYDELTAATEAAILATAAANSATSAADTATSATNSAAQSASASARVANTAADAATAAAQQATAAAENARPYYFQAAEPPRAKRVDGMLWLHANESAKTAVAKRWDADLPGKAVFPGEGTMPGASTVIDEIGAWTQFAL